MKQTQHSESWQALPWKQFQKTLFRLQHRVWKAIQANDKRRAKNLQKLILRSKCAIFMAIRQVTQLNQGKQTAGVDGRTALEGTERFQLAKQLEEHTFDWAHQKLREIPIPKKDGTLRVLKVPTIADRAWQCLVKYAMEPAHEATFHPHSYGFRPGRGCRDAQKHLFQKLCHHGKQKTVLEVDIEKCFDRIDHGHILSAAICPQAVKVGLLRCLKAGTSLGYPDQGTPQGGVISPLLANIALEGVETVGRYKASNGRTIDSYIRYADDMVFVLPKGIEPESVLSQLERHLAPLKLNVSQAKTRITSSTNGFDFLGWHFRVMPKGKLRITPSKGNYRAFRKKVKDIIISSNISVPRKVERLAPLVSGWRNYHKYCYMSGSNFSASALRLAFVRRLRTGTSLTRHERKKAVEAAFLTVGYKQNGHVKVKGTKTPFDGDINYWSQRKSKHYQGLRANLLKKQGHKCWRCKLSFIDNEPIHLHHIDANHSNHSYSNCAMVHESCHDYIHMNANVEAR
ncbi:reverse transcriptase domain-containing protein [cf. Phormidesmis sp. LEGE 11477]|uniref:reverse transcriptase domain-containing protein n=1 Tax=cf. Phormidesmis sp. LEGE 11477 TaxID=1828680 RepID=UPI001880F477|nr:reverse transcriptase domain-containing protein [cf. Phormidesmis sp. LEGE 11477]MBE9062679.1 reverse transcriptase N-terminal domain-containing protein [cf. Phormidesmis sp. LEGE 11477]